MTTDQQERLTQIAEAVTTARQLLQQAKTATCTNEMWSVIPARARFAVADALDAADRAERDIERVREGETNG